MAVRGREQGANVVELPMSGDADVGFIFRFAALLKQLKPDLVHVHSRRGADVWGGLGAKWAGVPAVVSRRVDISGMCSSKIDMARRRWPISSVSAMRRWAWFAALRQ